MAAASVAQAQPSAPPLHARDLARGDFILVRADHPDPYRRGKDGMVTEVLGDGTIGLMFGADRHNQSQRVVCVGTEAWDEAELDFTSVAR